MTSNKEDSILEEPPLESPEILVSKVMQLHRSFKALLADHAIPILRQTEYVHTGAYALEALVNALSGTTLQVRHFQSYNIRTFYFCLSTSLALSLHIFTLQKKKNMFSIKTHTINKKNDDSACVKEEKTR